MLMLKPKLQTLKNQGPKSISATTRLRGSTLQKIREAKLLANPACELCIKEGIVTPAVEVDHITPLWAGGQETDINRQSICHEHHKAKSAQEARQRHGKA